MNCVSSQDEAGNPARGPNDTALCSPGEGLLFVLMTTGGQPRVGCQGVVSSAYRLTPAAGKDIC